MNRLTSHIPRYDCYVAKTDANDQHRIIAVETTEEAVGGVTIAPITQYLAGPIVDRLAEYEDLGFEPEQIREILWRYRILSLAMNLND